jgi:hypothetical protein
MKKKYLKAKEEELWELKYFTMQKYINLQKKKKPLKETKILQDIYYNSILINNLKFQHKPKILILKKEEEET